MSDRRLAAVIEVGPDSTGQVPVELVRAAYRASRDGTVVLVLNGVSPRQVDRALDPVVSRSTVVTGVLYCSPAELEPLLDHRGWPPLASVATGALAEPLERHGVRLLPRRSVFREIGRMRRDRAHRAGEPSPS